VTPIQASTRRRRFVGEWLHRVCSSVAHTTTVYAEPRGGSTMTNSVSCPECGAETDAADDLESGPTVPAIEPDDDGTISLYGTRDLFLCSNCRATLGVSR
jgi:hypothetical protein